jgi:hypothetical protein
MSSTGVNVRIFLVASNQLSHDIFVPQIISLTRYNSFLVVIADLMFSCQVLRYSALAAGVLYGLYHQASLSASAKLAAINREYEHKQSLIEKAKAEYSKKNKPANKTESGGSKSYEFLMIFHPRFRKPTTLRPVFQFAFKTYCSWMRYLSH